MLAANTIRDICDEEGLDIRMGFFLHIPFPSFDIIRIFPWVDEILQGMLGRFYYTVWKFQNFPTSQFFREINLKELMTFKPVIFDNSRVFLLLCICTSMELSRIEFSSFCKTLNTYGSFCNSELATIDFT